MIKWNLGVVLSLCLALPVLADDSLPAPWKDQDIGAATTPGAARYAAGVFTLKGTMDLWGVADGCHIAWQPCHGDFELVARVAGMENPGGVAHAKAAICLRQSLDAGARHVTLCVTAADGTQLLSRDTPDGKTSRVDVDAEAQKAKLPKAQFPCWLKLVRRGKEFRAYESSDGQTWRPTGQVALDLPADAIVGLTASSHKKDILAAATFDHVELLHTDAATRPTPEAGK